MKQSYHLLCIIFCASLLTVNVISAQAQVTRKKSSPVQAQSPPATSPGSATGKRDSAVVAVGPGSKPVSDRFILLANPCALITADEIEQIFRVSNNRALVTVDHAHWTKAPSSVSCNYNLKYVNLLYPEDREPAFPENAYLDSAGVYINLEDKYAKQGQLILYPKENQVIEIVNGLGDEAQFLLDKTEQEKNYGIAGGKQFTNFQNRDQLYVRKGDVVLTFLVWKRVGDYRGKMIEIARKILGRMP
jgi:hypothetical protein